MAYNHIYSILTLRVYMKQKLSAQLLYTLSQFAKQKKRSAYQIRKMLDNTPFECRYKNVWERVQSLFSLGLIKEIAAPDAEHGAIYYTLTSYGIETLVTYDRRDGADYFINELVENYGSDKLFKTFAYQSFEKTTLGQISNNLLLGYIREYLGECVWALRDMRGNISLIRKNRFPGSVEHEDQERAISNKKEVLRISVNDYLLRLVFFITEMSMVEGNPIFPDFEPTRVHDLELLTNDRKFSLVLDKFKKIMTLRFDTLMKYRK
jgi:hypothetical protein